MKNKSILFWQPQRDYLRFLSSLRLGRILLIFLNYAIWLFFLYLSFLLIRSNFNIFWQLFFATFLAELAERVIKKKVFWRRPMFLRHDQTPVGLIDHWYRSGAFPSGHTIKATFFFLFLLQNPVFPLSLFLIISLSLLFFRVLVGFHYPIDILGGILIGLLVWLPTHLVYFPPSINYYPQIIFSSLFPIK